MKQRRTKDTISLNEAEEELRKIKESDPEKFEEIRSLRDGIRCSVSKDGDKYFVFCHADRYSQLYLVNSKGEILEKEVAKIIGMLRNQLGKSSIPISNDFNLVVTKVKEQFYQDVISRYLEQRNRISLNNDQRYIQNKLLEIYNHTENNDLKSQIELFDGVFTKVQRPAVLSELKKLRKNNVVGRALLDRLTEIWYRHNLQEIMSEKLNDDIPPVPVFVCGEIV